jgi:hypothetical protein
MSKLVAALDLLKWMSPGLYVFCRNAKDLYTFNVVLNVLQISNGDMS